MALARRLPALVGRCLPTVQLKAFRPGCTLYTQCKLKALPSLSRQFAVSSTSSRLLGFEIYRSLTIATLRSRRSLFAAFSIGILATPAAAECEGPEDRHTFDDRSCTNTASVPTANEMSRHGTQKTEDFPADGPSAPPLGFASLFAGGLVVVYTAVFSLWRTLIYLEENNLRPKLMRYLETLVKRYFICILDELRRGRLCTLIFSAVSHNNILHFLMNAAGTWLFIHWDSEYEIGRASCRER